MNDPGPTRRPTSRESFAGVVGAKAKRKLAAKRSSAAHGVWHGVGMMGLIGWSVVIPTLLGAGLGLWLDAKHPGKFGWTLALLMAGLVLGCANAWHWVAKEEREMREDPEDEDE
ncbi:MAG: AtpZ/AtpI family protein [Byssovorax sp.]